MLINTKSKFAVIAMINLAQHAKGSPMNAADLAKRQKQSVSHLEQLLSKLRKAGLVVSSRGPRGGYLATHLDITVAQIVKAVMGKEPASVKGWVTVSKAVGAELHSIKLRDLIL